MIVNGKLTEAAWHPSPNHGGALIQPRVLCLHYTAGSTLDSSTTWLCNPKSKASAHLIIGRDGAVNQLVDFAHVAWHAGQSVYNSKTGVNSFSFGIEMDNLGGLMKSADGLFRSPTNGKIVQPENVVEGEMRGCSYKYWHAYTPVQVEKCIEICHELVEAYPSIMDVVGHSDVAPGRKIDPGVAFPMQSVHSAIFGRA